MKTFISTLLMICACHGASAQPYEIGSDQTVGFSATVSNSMFIEILDETVENVPENVVEIDGVLYYTGGTSGDVQLVQNPDGKIEVQY